MPEGDNGCCQTTEKLILGWGGAFLLWLEKQGKREVATGNGFLL
jgi:hypothetical protein